MDFIVNELGFVTTDQDGNPVDHELARQHCIKLISEHGGQHLLIQKDSGLSFNGNGNDQTFKRASEAAINRDGGPSARPAG